MGHPVTTNPFIIMTINMTVVFLVLIGLLFMIKLIHALDPTKPKEEPVSAPAVSAPAPVQEVAPAAPQGVSPEVVAVIAAAVTAMGYSTGQVRAIRPINRDAWKNSGRDLSARRL